MVERVLYHALSVVIGFCVSSTALHIWCYGTVRWPVTYLAIATLSLHVRQIIYNEIMRKALIQLCGSQPVKEVK